MKQKKKQAMNQKAESLMEYNSNKNFRKFYKTAKYLTSDFKPRNTCIKDKTGTLLMETGEIIKRWHEYFKEKIENPSYEEIMEIIKKDGKDVAK